MNAGPFTTLESDPCPGEPDDIATLGAALRRTAVLLTETALALDRTDASQDRWKGRAADAFRTKLNTHRATLGKIRAALEDGAEVLDGWAGALRDLQEEARRLDAAATHLDGLRRANAQALSTGARLVDAAGEGAAARAAVTLGTRETHEAHDLADRFTGVLGQAGQLHERYLEAARAAARRVTGLLTLPPGTRGWYGAGTDAGTLTALQAEQAADAGASGDVTPVYDQNVKDALAYFSQNIGDKPSLFDPLASGLFLTLFRLQGLSDGELEAFAEHLSPEQLDELNQALAQGDPSMRMAWSNRLLGTVSPATLATLQIAVPNLQPQLTDNADATYRPFPDTPLFGPGGPDITQDLHQGGCGDCWFLSSVAAITERDPSFCQQHIHENPNGTYTVTFYQDGKPVPVTVDNQLPVSPHWNNGPEYAQTGETGTMWVAVYEKAYAQYKGGYNVIGQGGYGNVGLHDLTGQPTQRVDAGDTSLADLAQKINNGYAVTTGSKQETTGHLWWSHDVEFSDNDKVVSCHEYSVESVNLNAHPPTVTLLNPWGPGSVGADKKPVPQQVTMTEDEWHQYYDEVSYTSTRV